jgi:glycosyltransferase involved in cell wall biosynthesis
LRIWDLEASRRPDVLVSISKYVQSEVKRIYRRDSVVIYPGVDTEYYTPSQDAARDDVYFVVSRLQWHKRIDLAILACEKLGRKLLIAGSGPHGGFLKKLAGQHTKFLGYLSDEEIRDHLRRARAFLFPGLEDFGLTAVEAMSCGCPVIAYNRGGVAEIVVDGSTGLLFDEQSVGALSAAIVKFENMKFNHLEVTTRAQEFSEDYFLNRFQKFIDDEYKSWKR